MRRCKYKTVILFLCLTHWNVFAQHTIRVLNKENKQAIASADVFFPDLKTSTATDKNGYFSINTKNETVFSQISCVGYATFLETIILQKDTIIYLDPSHQDLQEVVISGNSSKLQGENVLDVEKISLINNPELPGISLAQKLTNLAGISNFSTGAGIGKPVIRGMSGNRIAVFSQGVRIENQQWGDEHGLGIDENGYEQVEIIKGPASLLYGSDALGGVVYFADERYAKNNSIESVINSEFHSNTNGWRNTGAFKVSKKHWHANFFGGYDSYEDYSDGNGNAVYNSRFHTGNFKTSLGYTGEKYITSLKYSFLNEQYGLSDSTKAPSNLSIGKRQPDYPYQNLTTHLISSENTVLFENEAKLKVDVGYIFNNRKEFESATEDRQANLNMNLGTFSYNARWYSPQWHNRWSIIAGSQGMYQTNSNRGGERLIPDAVTVDAGIFITSDYYYTKKSYWQTGVRTDNRHISSQPYGNEGESGYFPKFSKDYTAFVFSTGVYHQLTKSLSLRGNLSSGYRAPTMFELLSDGIHDGTNRYEIGNSALKIENSYQADISLNYKTRHLELFLNPYLNYIRNYIYLQPTGEINENLPVYHYVQDNAYLYGGEAGFHFHPHPNDWLHFSGTYSSTFGQDTKHNHLPLMPSQKVNLTVRASFPGKKALQTFSAYVQEEYSFAQNLIAQYETPTPAYNLVNIGLTFDLNIEKQKIIFDAIAENIFNETYYDHLSRYKQYGIYDMGRNLTFRVSLPF